MDLIFLIIAIFDTIIVTTFVVTLIKRLTGDSPPARLLRLLLSIACGIGYFILCAHLGWGETEASLTTFLSVFILPIGLIVVLKVVEYMFKK